MKYTISQKHIDAGRRGSRGLCPTSLCLKEAHPNSKRTIFTTSSHIYLNKKKVLLPYDLSTWILTYDYHGAEAVRPITFEL